MRLLDCIGRFRGFKSTGGEWEDLYVVDGGVLPIDGEVSADCGVQIVKFELLDERPLPTVATGIVTFNCCWPFGDKYSLGVEYALGEF